VEFAMPDPESARVTPRAGKVFADLGYENPDEAILKAQLVYKIGSIIEDRSLTQMEAARILGVDQPKVSALMNGRMSNFSVEQLLRFLAALGEDVEIVVRAKAHDRERGQVTLVFGRSQRPTVQPTVARLVSPRSGTVRRYRRGFS
jgi:predicted XRE-type DNA-binding protein